MDLKGRRLHDVLWILAPLESLGSFLRAIASPRSFAFNHRRGFSLFSFSYPNTGTASPLVHNKYNTRPPVSPSSFYLRLYNRQQSRTSFFRPIRCDANARI